MVEQGTTSYHSSTTATVKTSSIATYGLGPVAGLRGTVIVPVQGGAPMVARVGVSHFNFIQATRLPEATMLLVDLSGRGQIGERKRQWNNLAVLELVACSDIRWLAQLGSG